MIFRVCRRRKEPWARVMLPRVARFKTVKLAGRNTENKINDQEINECNLHS